MQSIFRQLSKLSVTPQILVSDCVNFCATGFRSRTTLAAEDLFLPKQLALFQEREKKAVPTTAADRFVLSKLAGFFDLSPTGPPEPPLNRVLQSHLDVTGLNRD